ncbi:MAG TPA: HlyC/CorC family transporter [Anaerolineae bacterium]|nr:HlyC/CorC family transporter [Anaerolineae bacterium]
MDVPLGLSVGILALSFLLMFFVALAEVSLATISRSHVRKLSEEGISSAQRIELLLKDAQRFLAGILVLKTGVIVLATAAASVLTLSLTDRGWWWVLSFVLVGFTLLLLQVWGRAVAVHHPLAVASRVAGPMRWIILLVSPLTWALLKLAHGLGLTRGNEVSERNIFVSEDGLRLLLNLGDEEHYLEEDERELINSIFRFSETAVAEVMVPRVDVVALPKDTPLLEALDVIVRAGHSRIPVYEDTIDKIVGILYAKDLLTCFRDGNTDITVESIMRPPFFVPETMMVDELLPILRQKRTHMAIVVDEYGGTAGIVTIEDLLEEIVGEIQDEYDSEPPMIQPQEDGSYIVNGRMDVDDLNRELGVHLPTNDESYSTLAGVIYAQLQRVPDPGDSFDLDGVHIEVIKVKDNRIEEVRLTLREPEAQTRGDEEKATVEEHV